MSITPVVQTEKQGLGVWYKRVQRQKWLQSSALLLAGLVAWEGLSRMGLISKLILPAPTKILGSTFFILSTDTFPTHFGITMWELVVGYSIAVLLGASTGALLGIFPLLKRLLFPYVVIIQSIPKIVFAPIFITWLGFGLESKIAMAVVVGFFPIFINTMTGLLLVPENLLQLMKSLLASKWQTFVKVSLPHALPTIFAGLKSSLTFAFIGTIIGEFQGARAGLGYLIQAYSAQIAVDRTFAVVLILSIMSVLLFQLVDRIERRIVYWGDKKTGMIGI